VTRELKLAGFLVVLAAIFIGAHAAGSHLGPVTTTHAQVTYTGTSGGRGMMMNMGGGGSGGRQEPAPVVAPRGGRR
jgi:hypothetical protein